jgi:TonB family protein
MRDKTFLAYAICLLFALLSVRADAQTCSGMYESASGVLQAYRSYDAASANGRRATDSRKAMIVRANEFVHYASAYFRAADGIDVDSDALISQCDNDTRIAVYKAAVEISVFFARTGTIDDKSSLDSASALIHRLMLVLQKSNRQDPDLARLDDQLKRAYSQQHLSLPQDLLEVDAHARVDTAPNDHHACANPNVDVTVTNPVEPDYPASARDLGFGPVTVEVKVTVGAGGNVIGTLVSKSSSNMAIDQAALRAARESTYSARLVDCQPTQGDFLFRADLIPNG